MDRPGGFSASSRKEDMMSTPNQLHQSVAMNGDGSQEPVPAHYCPPAQAQMPLLASSLVLSHPHAEPCTMAAVSGAPLMYAPLYYHSDIPAVSRENGYVQALPPELHKHHHPPQPQQPPLMYHPHQLCQPYGTTTSSNTTLPPSYNSASSPAASAYSSGSRHSISTTKSPSSPISTAATSPGGIGDSVHSQSPPEPVNAVLPAGRVSSMADDTRNATVSTGAVSPGRKGSAGASNLAAGADVSTSASASAFPFIALQPGTKSDPATRKMIRSYVMRGKNRQRGGTAAGNAGGDRAGTAVGSASARLIVSTRGGGGRKRANAAMAVTEEPEKPAKYPKPQTTRQKKELQRQELERHGQRQEEEARRAVMQLEAQSTQDPRWQEAKQFDFAQPPQGDTWQQNQQQEPPYWQPYPTHLQEQYQLVAPRQVYYQKVSPQLLENLSPSQHHDQKLQQLPDKDHRFQCSQLRPVESLPSSQSEFDCASIPDIPALTGAMSQKRTLPPFQRLQLASFHPLYRQLWGELGEERLGDEMQPYMRVLVKDHFAFLDAAQYPKALVRDPQPATRRELDMWQEMLSSDASYFHALLFAAQAYFEYRRRGIMQVDNLARKHLQLSFRALQERLPDRDLAISDSTLCTVVTLLFVASCIGDIKASRHHLDGLKRIVVKRGGLDKLDPQGHLRLKVCRVDLATAVISSSKPVFYDGGMVYTRTISDEPSTSPLSPNAGLRTLLFYYDIRLTNIWADMRSFCGTSNLITADPDALRPTKYCPRYFQEVMISLQYRLLHLHGVYENIIAEEALRLAMLLFTVSIYFQLQGGRLRFAGLGSQLEEVLITLQDVTRYSKGTPLARLVLWMYMVAAGSYVKKDTLAKSRGGELARRVREAVMWAGLAGEEMPTWNAVRELMKSLLWIETIHDVPGELAYGVCMGLVPSERTLESVRDDNKRRGGLVLNQGTGRI